MQLCVGDEFLFPLAKPSRSFQNLTETPLGKKSALIILLLSKSRKNGHKMRITKGNNSQIIGPKPLLNFIFSIGPVYVNVYARLFLFFFFFWFDA